jgi:hypothetical protein
VTPLLPPTVIGSYPQPDWLVDRAVGCAPRLPPRGWDGELSCVASRSSDAAAALHDRMGKETERPLTGGRTTSHTGAADRVPQ